MTFTFCSDGTKTPYDLHSCWNCCGQDSLIMTIPESLFNYGVEKAAPDIYFRLKSKGQLKLQDLDDCFTFAEKAFKKAWFQGEFVNYLPNCQWDENNKQYLFIASSAD